MSDPRALLHPNGTLSGAPAASQETKRPDGLTRAPSTLFDAPRRADSVLMGRDPEALDILLALHASAEPRILDCTHNTGKMWKGAAYQPTHRMDIDETYPVDTVGDFRAMPFGPGAFDVIVFDPPHLPNAYATNERTTGHADVYGVRVQETDRAGDNVTALFPAFLAEAARVLAPEGIVISKLTDLVHNHAYQWQLVDFINAVREAGLTPCDLLVKRDPAGGNLKSSKWKNVRHLKRVHSYFIVVRKGRCERKAAA